MGPQVSLSSRNYVCLVSRTASSSVNVMLCWFLLNITGPDGLIIRMDQLPLEDNSEACKIHLHDMQRHSCKILIVFGSKIWQEATNFRVLLKVSSRIHVKLWRRCF